MLSWFWDNAGQGTHHSLQTGEKAVQWEVPDLLGMQQEGLPEMRVSSIEEDGTARRGSCMFRNGFVGSGHKVRLYYLQPQLILPFFKVFKVAHFMVVGIT